MRLVGGGVSPSHQNTHWTLMTFVTLCVTAEVLVNDAIRRGEEGKDVGDEVAFVVSETIPICSVGLEVDLFSSPE